MQSTLTEFQETQSQDAFALQNAKLLKVRLDKVTIQAKLGSMVAYQGEVSFEHAGSGGMGRLLKKAMTGEGTSLMKMSGTGEVFLADEAQEIHLLHLDNDGITVNGRNLLAFDAGIDWDIKRVEGASGMMGGGLYNTALKGSGWVAVLSDGPPVLLNPEDAPTFADPNAAITWASTVQDRYQDGHQAEELHRPRVGRVHPDVVHRAGLGARAAERGSRAAHPGRRRRRAARQPVRLSPRGGSPILQFVKSCARLAFLCPMRRARSAQPRTSSAGSGRSS